MLSALDPCSAKCRESASISVINLMLSACAVPGMDWCSRKALVNNTVPRTTQFDDVGPGQALIRLSLLSFTQTDILAAGAGALIEHCVSLFR